MMGAILKMYLAATGAAVVVAGAELVTGADVAGWEVVGAEVVAAAVVVGAGAWVVGDWVQATTLKIRDRTNRRLMITVNLFIAFSS